jgi:hypothetical protein
MVPTHLMKRLIERMAIQALPDTHYNAPARSQNTMHFREGFMSVGKEHQSELAHYQVKAFIWEWELLSRACTPFNRETFPIGRCASHAEHGWIEIETDDPTLCSNAWSEASGDDPCPTRHIQNMLTWLHIRGLNQVADQGANRVGTI